MLKNTTSKAVFSPPFKGAKMENKRMVRLHNNFVEAIYSLSVDAKKLLLSIILHMNSENKIKIHRKEIIDEIGIDLKNLKPRHRENIIEELMTKIITIRDKDNPDDRWKKMQLLMLTEYDDGILTTSIYPELFPYFKEAQERLFTRFNIQNIKPLTSIYAIRLYELAKQYDDTGWRVIELDELRKMLKLDGKYKDNKDFRKWVLDVAKKQINKNTDINIDYELIKEGRKYTKIRLKISRNKNRVERKENKKLIENGKHTELEARLNRQLKGKAIKGSDGLMWYINKVKVLNDKEVEIEITNLNDTKKITKKIDELQEFFA